MWRVARRSWPRQPSTISARDAELPRSGNRFDVPDVGVLYFATDVRGCFAETLARFRAHLVRSRAPSRRRGRRPAPCGPRKRPGRVAGVRTKIRVTCPDVHVYFVDVDDRATHTHLLGVLAAELHQLGVENLDVSTIRGPDRRVTRLVSLWAYMPPGRSERGVRRHPLRVTSRTVGVLGCLRRCSRRAGRAATDRAGRPGDALGRQRLWVANLPTPCRARYVRRVAATPRPTHGSAERHGDV